MVGLVVSNKTDEANDRPARATEDRTYLTARTDTDKQGQEYLALLERLLAERTSELYDSEHRWRSFFALPMVGTAITSRSKGWIAANDETCRILGYPRDELFRTSWAELTHPDDLAADVEQFERMLRREIDGYTLDKRFIHKDGRIVHTILSGGCGAIGDATPDTFYVTILDVSDSRMMEAELAAARERDDRSADEARATLEKKLKTSLNAAATAHEINQPLSRVILRARMGLETAKGADRGMLAALVADAERVVSVIEKMKVLLRNVETVQHEVDLAAVMASALHQVKRPLRDAGMTVVRQGLDRGCLVLGDDVQLQMIVINLLTNAIEAIVAGKTPRREIVVEQNTRDGIVEMVVGDSGPGWPGGAVDEMLLNTTKAGGSGIGLYVVKTAVDNHRGEMTIGRSPLGGAEFRITFPLANAATRSRTVSPG
jgi:PAS domain S-box-containing protein